MKIAVIGGGIGGLALALSLHRHGLECDVYEAAPVFRELGVGITVLPHAMRELAGLGLQHRLEALGIENLESVFFNRFGQFIYREPRGVVVTPPELYMPGVLGRTRLENSALARL